MTLNIFVIIQIVKVIYNALFEAGRLIYKSIKKWKN